MTTFNARAPQVGEMIHGCRCFGSACGAVKSVGAHVTDDGMNHYFVTEDFNDRTVRAKREANGLLYEVKVIIDYRD